MLALSVTPSATTSSSASLIVLVVVLAIAVFYVAAAWRIFTKAGKPGWVSLIPIYNTVVLLRIAGRPGWWFLLLLIPFVNIIILVIFLNDLSKAFGHGIGFTLGLIFLSLIFYPILGFGSSRYVGRAA
ncbi:MAG: signal peptidase I [Ktedonobacterales bacterium]|nr:signal peptidase I [Ktedonobacterales bacterium]